jgi:hypothetical protein
VADADGRRKADDRDLIRSPEHLEDIAAGPDDQRP